MNSEAREYLKRHIQVKLVRSPNTKLGQMRHWILGAKDSKFNFEEVKKDTLKTFIRRNVKQMKETGSLDRQKGSGGQNALSRRDVSRIKRLSLNKKRRSTRKVAAIVGVSFKTVQNVLQREGPRLTTGGRYRQ